MLVRTECKIAAVLLMTSVMATDAMAERRGGRDAWVELGCQSVGFVVDRDVIKVGSREGRFKAIRLVAHGNRVHMLDLKVVYVNGAPDDLPVRAELRPGVPTRAIDLRGRERAIQHIEMVYRAQPSFRGRARICAQGLD